MINPEIYRFINCRILRGHKIIVENLWVRNGKIINPERVFFDEKTVAHHVIDCKGSIIAPGFIDLQINGGAGIDFSNILTTVEEGVDKVAKLLLEHGVTSFCPTLVTSPPGTYHEVLPKIKKRNGGPNGATILGVHLEGPFINVNKKGAHPPECIKPLQKGMASLMEMYGTLENVKIVTLAPELMNACEVTSELHKKDIVVSVGHSMANLSEGEKAVQYGARLITHLFNAMPTFHHRDPGLVGLLSSDSIPNGVTVYFGIISDGIHTHPAALRIAYRTHPEGLILVTDAISVLGLEAGQHKIGQLFIEVRDNIAYIAGTDTLCGSIANMNQCIQIFLKATGCSKEYALETASLHPARALGIEKQKGTLDFDADADFVLLDDELNVQSTWIAGKCVFQK